MAEHLTLNDIMSLIPKFLRRQSDATKPSAKTFLTPHQERTMLAVLAALKPHSKTSFVIQIDRTQINMTGSGGIGILCSVTGGWRMFDTLEQFEAACCEQAKN